jgi:hypothetical protein
MGTDRKDMQAAQPDLRRRPKSPPIIRVEGLLRPIPKLQGNRAVPDTGRFAKPRRLVTVLPGGGLALNTSFVIPLKEA